jgi:hypothetical protein
MRDKWELLRIGAPFSLTPTSELAISIAHRWNPADMVTVLTSYLDEAGTDGRYPFVVVAGYVSTVLKWHDFDKKWNKTLRKKGLDYFHAMDCKPHKPPFNTWRPGEFSAFVNYLGNLILTRTLFGFVIRLELEDYNKYYIGPGPIKGVQLDSKYGICARVAISFMDTILTEHFSDKFRVNIIMESGDKSIGAGDAMRVLRQLKEHVPEIARHFGTITYGDKREFPGLQAADSTASPAHRIEREGGAEMIPFLEGETLADARKAVVASKGAPVYRIRIDGPILRDMRTNIQTWKQYRRDYWQSGVRRNPDRGEGE